MKRSVRLPQTDAALVRRAKRGDKDAFASIFERYHQDLYRYCRAIVGDPQEAQDALQGTMLKSIAALRGEPREIALKPWLYRIAHNEAVSIVRLRRDSTEITDDAVSAPPPDVAIAHRESVRQLVADLGDLPENQRAALVLKELSGLSHNEIAAALQLTPGAARQSVYEARLALQQITEGREMECEQVRIAISDSDGRVMRGRRIRAHLNSCAGCEEFASAIHTRQQVFSFAAPALPAAASSGIFAAATGGSAAIGAGVGAGAFGAGSLGIVAAGAIVLAGAGSLAGMQLSESSDDRAGLPAAIESIDSTRGDGDAEQSRGSGSTGITQGESSSKPEREQRGERGGRAGNRDGNSGSRDAGTQSGGGASSAAQAESGRPEIPPGSNVASENSNGNSNTPTTGPPPQAQGPPDYSNAGGSGSNAGGNGNGNSGR